MNASNTHTHPLVAAVDSIAAAVDQALIIAVEGQSSDVLLARLAEARAGIVRVDLITHVIEVVPADQLPVYPTPNQLPKLQLPKDTRKWEKQRPGIASKLRSPRAYDCPTCGAEAGTNCFVFSHQGKHGKVTDQRNTGSTYHTARSALSKTANERVRREYDRTQAKSTERS